MKINAEELLKSRVMEALGEASMCWNPTPSGVFDSDGAIDVGDRLIEDINTILSVHQQQEKSE